MPRVLAIRDAIVAALDAITVSDGFAHDLSGRVRPAFVDVAIGSLPIAFVGIRREDSEATVVHDAYQCTLSFEVLAIPAQPFPDPTTDAEASSNADAYASLAADLKRALMAQRDRDPPLGIPGVLDVRIDGWEILPRDGDVVFDGVGLSLSVVYRHDSGDPETYLGTSL